METTKTPATEAVQNSATNLEYSFIPNPVNTFFMLDMYCSRLLNIFLQKDSYWRNFTIKNNKPYNGFFYKSIKELAKELGTSSTETRLTIETLFRAKLIYIQFGGNNHLNNNFKINYETIIQFEKEDLKTIMIEKVCSIKKISRDSELTYRGESKISTTQMSSEVLNKCVVHTQQMCSEVLNKCRVGYSTNVDPTIDIAEENAKDEKTKENNYRNNNIKIDNLKEKEQPTVEVPVEKIYQPSNHSFLNFPRGLKVTKEVKEVNVIEEDEFSTKAIQKELEATEEPKEIYLIFKKWFSNAPGTPSDKVYDFKTIFSTEKILSLGEYMTQEHVQGHNAIKKVINEVTVAVEDQEDKEDEDDSQLEDYEKNKNYEYQY